MQRFFVPEASISGAGAEARVVFGAAQAAQMARVLRLRRGDLVVAVARGCEHTVELRAVSPRGAEGVVRATARPQREPPLRVVLAQGLPKGEKIEMIVQKAVELGVSEIVPVWCERSVPRPPADRLERRRERWQTIAREAAEQSGRLVEPPVRDLIGVDEALRLPEPGALALLLWEGEAGRGLRKALSGWRAGDGGAVWLFVGPEGGWSPVEVARARAAGLTTVGMGPRVLRTETAGPAAVAIVLYELGDLGDARPPIGDGEEPGAPDREGGV